jgi:4-amino-4-deoxy-L-arabinose transferase-like glycosyltransferase
LRTDTLLTAFVILSTLQIYRFTLYKNTIDLLWGAVFVGLAMLAKGPIGLIIPAMALGGHWLLNREWKNIFKWEWLLALIVVALVLAPMSYGLYMQFDSQPDKITQMPSPKGIFPVEGVSGLRFFFWEQSFGRITGENVWKDNSGPFFFTHNFLWSFMPWALLAVFALFRKSIMELKSLFTKGKGHFLLLSGFLLPFIALSTSQYKLPHYIFPLYPFAALITAEFIVDAFGKNRKLDKGLIHFGALLTLIVSLSLSFVLLFWVFNVPTYLRFVLPPLAIVCIWTYFQKNKALAIVLSLAMVSALTNIVLNSHFYPLLLKYQKGSEMAFLAKSMGAQKENTAYYRSFVFSFDYYMQSSIPVRPAVETIRSTDQFIFSLAEGLEDLKAASLPIDTVVRFDSYPITELTPAFLNPATRESTLVPIYLVVLDQP